MAAASTNSARPDDHASVARTSAERPPLASEAWVLSEKADLGLAPRHLFWEDVPEYSDAAHIAAARQAAADHEAAGELPLIGMQLWEDSFEKSLPEGLFGAISGHGSWVEWIGDRPGYLGVTSDGGVHYATDANPHGWGYVSPLMPLDAGDVPAGFTGTDATYADWLADRLGRLAGHTGVRGFQFADFYDGSPHSGVMNYFNPRIIQDFERERGIDLAGDSLAEQAAEIKSEHAQEYLDYFVEGWAYGWQALEHSVERHTGQEPWFVTQVSFTPAAMREFAAVDVREIGERVDLDSMLFHVQTLERFEMQHKPAPASYEAAMIGTHAARAPQAHFGHMMSSSEDDYWNAVSRMYPGVTGEDREELGWGRLKQTWLQSGWTHIADGEGDVRRASEAWSRSYHDWGEVDAAWLELLRDIVPSRPFGPALYYSANAEKAMNAIEPVGNAVENAYLGELLTPITRLHDAGVPFGYYVSDAALASIDEADAPSAWIIPERFHEGQDLFTEAELDALEEIAPVLVGEEALNHRHPLNFSDTVPGAEITGFGFYDQHDRLIVVASDRVDFDDDGSRADIAATVSLDLPDGDYRVEDLLNDRTQTFSVRGGTGDFDIALGRWDTGVYAITEATATDLL
ncbi:hypothetical protein [Azospirillum sp. SYSU D00513]|uniref:hypothetical protein n=1 Tax=Azospirillum sp. SYSU D00513 TaxID=2812561 RepID=UPI001A960973|nr:hypothetical protein [Azospirillum sp. SYSU D00513]